MQQDYYLKVELKLMNKVFVSVLHDGILFGPLH